MICSVFHFLDGYCKVVLSGRGQERLLNICVSRQVLVWNLTRSEDHYIFYVSRAGLQELEEVAEKTGCTYRVAQKKGLPFLFYRYRKRKVFFGIAVLAAVAIYVMSLFLWQIQTTGCQSHSSEEILGYLAEKGIREGRRLSTISCGALEEQLRRDFEDIAWASCDIKGTLLTVSIKETIDKEALNRKDTDDSPCSLVASKKGVIDSIMVRSGSAVVKKGDKVRRGDLLISGAVELYDDSGELTETALVRASGDIKAITVLPYENAFPLVYHEKKYTGRRQNRYGILLGDTAYFAPAAKNSFEVCDELLEQKPLCIGKNLYLPVTFLKKSFLECEIQTRKYTKEQAEAEAKRRLKLFLQEYEEKGVEILKNNVTIDFDETMCRAGGKITVKESFGKIRNIRKSELADVKKARVLEE